MWCEVSQETRHCNAPSLGQESSCFVLSVLSRCQLSFAFTVNARMHPPSCTEIMLHNIVTTSGRMAWHKRLLLCPCIGSEYACARSNLLDLACTCIIYQCGHLRQLHCRALKLPPALPVGLASLHCAGSTIVPPPGSSLIVIPDGSNVSLVQCQLPCSSGIPQPSPEAPCNLQDLAQPAQLMHGVFCVSNTATLSLHDCTTSCNGWVRITA